MPIIKGDYAQNFTVLPNSTLQDARLSFDARGVLSLMLSMPKDWSMYKSWLISQCPKMGKDKMTRILKELQDNGYLHLKHKKDDKGCFDSYEWTVWPEPPNPEADFPDAGKPDTGKPATTKETVKQNKQVTKELFNFRSSMIGLGVDESLLNDWLRVRSNKKATNTETAFNALVSKFKSSGLTANECVRISAENSWAGFDKLWVKQSQTGQQQSSQAPKQYRSLSDTARL